MYDLVRQFNKYAGENKSLIQKALTSATGSGEALIPQHLEAIITNAIPRLSPALAMVTPKFDNQKYHEFNRLTALPDAGGAMGESAVTPTTQPAFERTGVYMKVIRRKGATTDFLKDSSKKYIDAAATNIEATMLAHVYDLENYIMYGNKGANAYEFSGLDHFCVTNRINQVAGGAVPANLSLLDDMIDRNLDLQGISHRKAFIMSPQMLSKFSQLLTNVRLNQGLSGGGMSIVDVPGGWRMNAYRDIPIIVSSMCRPKAAMGTITPSTVASGGTIPQSTTRYFLVSAVGKNGETLAAPEVTQATAGSGGSVHQIVLTFAAVTGAFRYKIYSGATSASEKLTWIIPAFTYDANGTIAGSITNTVQATACTVTSGADGRVTSVNFLSDPNTAGAMVPTGLQNDLALTGALATAPEYVFLWDLDEYQGLGRLPYTNEGGARFGGLVTIEDLAKTDDYLPFLVKSYCALADSFESTSVIQRGLKIA